MRPEELSGVVALDYQGITDHDKKNIMAATYNPPKNPRNEWDDGITYPTDPSPHQRFKILKNDNEDSLARKRALRRRHKDEVLKELEEELFLADSVKTVAGVTFEKGVPKAVDLDALDRREEGRSKKLRSMVASGIFTVAATGEKAEKMLGKQGPEPTQLPPAADEGGEDGAKIDASASPATGEKAKAARGKTK